MTVVVVVVFEEEASRRRTTKTRNQFDYSSTLAGWLLRAARLAINKTIKLKLV